MNRTNLIDGVESTCDKTVKNNNYNYDEKAILPSGKELGKKETEQFYLSQQSNPYYKKKFSVLGDSISTLDGYNPKGFNLFYTGENCTKSGVIDMKDTWWGKVIDYFGGELLVNNSWSGSRVTKLPGKDILFPSGCSDERTNDLHINETLPDVIIVYLGTNDWFYNVSTEHIPHKTKYEVFKSAYEIMLDKIKSAYPKAEIWCCTLCETFMSANPMFKFPGCHTGKDMSIYNDTIRYVVKQTKKCKLIDLASCKIAYDAVDGSHPTKNGMNTLATMVIRLAIGQEHTEILNCENNEHDFIVANAYTGETDFICKKCCFKKTESLLQTPISRKTNDQKINLTIPNEMPEDNTLNDSEYVIPDSNITITLYPNTLKVTNESTGENIVIQADEITVGRNNNCDIKLYNKYIAGIHAIFFHINNMWFIVDNHSTNGIWLDGERIKSGKKYLLTANNKIDFAHQLIFTFYKSENNQDTIVTKNNSELKSEIETFVSQRTDISGTVIDGRYKLEQIIGKGGFCDVYRGIDIKSDKKVAIKILRQFKGTNVNIAKNAILHETLIVSKFNHPAIPKIFDIIEKQNEIYVVREYIEGETLSTILTISGTQPVEKVVEWTKTIASALDYIHTFNPPYIHRDIKPQNIMLTNTGRIVLIDFDIAREYVPKSKPDFESYGTFGYAPPEQFNGLEDFRSDIYSLGMTMRQLLTSDFPMAPDFEIKPICQINPNLPKGLEYIIDKCLRKNPDDRYQSCKELINDLNDYEHLPKHTGFIKRLFGKQY